MKLPWEGKVKREGSLFLYRLFFTLSCLFALAALSFSLFSVQESAAQSSWLAEWLLYWTGLTVDPFFIRKLAHFVEYLMIGLVSAGALAQTAWHWKQACRLLEAGFLLAFTDETLQIFSGRGAAIPDVWLDLAGFLTGLLLSLLFFSLLHDFRKRRKPT